MKKLYLLVTLLMMIVFILGSACKMNDIIDSVEDDFSTIPNGAEIATSSSLVSYVNYVARVTGEKNEIRDISPNDKTPLVETTKWGIGGTDLGIPFYDSELKRLYFMYGDTFSTRPMSGAWNSNAILYTDDLNFKKGINWQGAINGLDTFGNGNNADYHRQITPDWRNTANVENGSVTQGTSTQIPTGAVVISGNYYLFYMEITEEGFGNNGEWKVYKNRVMKSSDSGKSWNQLDNIVFNTENLLNFGQVFPLVVEDYVYFYGLPGGRSGGVQMARVLKENIENMEEYEYFIQLNSDNTPKFIKGKSGVNYLKNQNFSSYVIPPNCGEMSVMYNSYLKKYVATYQSGSNIVLRTADSPFGPFSSATTLTSSSKYSQLYGAFTNEAMTTHEGKRMYFLLSRWSPIYNVQLMEIVFK